MIWFVVLRHFLGGKKGYENRRRETAKTLHHHKLVSLVRASVYVANRVLGVKPECRTRTAPKTMFQATDDTIAWYENLYGDGTFGLQRALSATVAGAVSVAAADVDGDGDNDVLCGAFSSSKVLWFENSHGTGMSWRERTLSTSANLPRWMDAADVDRDGDIDAVSVSQGDDTVAWYENNLELEACNGDHVPNACDADCNGTGVPIPAISQMRPASTATRTAFRTNASRSRFRTGVPTPIWE